MVMLLSSPPFRYDAVVFFAVFLIAHSHKQNLSMVAIQCLRVLPLKGFSESGDSFEKPFCTQIFAIAKIDFSTARRYNKNLENIPQEVFMSGRTSCEQCSNYVYDEDYDYYVCEMDLDEDEMYRFLSSSVDSCPYFRGEDEYMIVRKQM